MWEVKDRGFLPSADPITSYPVDKADRCGGGRHLLDLDKFMKLVPDLLEERKYREEVVSFLRDDSQVGRDIIYDIRSLYKLSIERLYKHFCYMASAYVHALHETAANRLPAEIATPLVSLARFLQRQPILSYSCYALNNWFRIDAEKPITVDNVKLQQNFSKKNKTDEDWFILIHVDIEAQAADGISAIKRYRDKFFVEEPVRMRDCDINSYASILKSMFHSLEQMNKTMSRMPEKCSEDFYFKAVRPFIFGFENVVYEGKGELYTLRGETGAQSSIIPAYVAALDIQHENSMLTVHLEDMLKYMPKEHREFILEIRKLGVYQASLREVSKVDRVCKELYNLCLGELLKFRTQHLEFAINYIQDKVDNPKGTGGTPFIPWLTQLRDETEGHYLK